MENENINLSLTVNEVNLLLQALQELPYRLSNQLIGNIQGQATAQVAKAKEESE